MVDDGQTIYISCDLPRDLSPFWFIDKTVYELLRIPREFLSIPRVQSFLQLTIPIVTRAINNTTFQCASFTPSGLILGTRAFRIIVSGKSQSVINTYQRC